MGLNCNIIADRPFSYFEGLDKITKAKIYAVIVDENGLPANGNGAIIKYSVNDDGLITQEEKAASGQSVLLFDGIIDKSHDDGFGNFVSYYSKTFGFATIHALLDAPPPINYCDLVINGINIDKPESSPGAGDGQISVQASSSYLPLSYSLDNINFQASNIFTGLSGGLKTVTVIDANNFGCVENITITVPVQSRLLVNDPSVIINGNTSRWNAAFNPIVFTYQRKDFEIISVSQDSASGKAKVLVNTDLTALIADDLVYINAAPYKGIYKFNALTRTGNSFIIDTSYAGNATGFININRLKPYYKLLTKITYQDTDGVTDTIISTNRPDKTGLIKADISNFLQSLVRVKDESDFTRTNFRDNNLSASYQIAYSEQWDDNNGDEKISDWIYITDPYYVVYAAKQLGERYGGNLAAYVPFANGQPPAKWITDFAEPAYSNGYPFDIGFIYSEHLLGLDIYCELTLLDINRKLLPGGPQNSYLLNDDNSWLLNQDGSKLVISRQTTANAPLAAQLGLNRLLINNDFPADAYYFTITLKYSDGSNIHAVTQTQTIRIDDAVDERSVYLRWIGLSGSWNYYRFVYNQEVTLDVQNATIIKNFVSDWENQDTIEDVISKTAGQKMKVMAEDLSVADIKGLQSIKYSPKVQMLVNKNSVKWQTIIINTATFSEYETLNGQAPFSVTFNMPGINIQTQ
ncbi:hypothetical protein [Mucilaginibacter sp. UR6-11]|uniref:hypothetical protein n=1 Tax=Mucilaginibacter sp. UR6-11 TaxID=1435644 RepID=UPI001E3BD421|nr:hypothetical protein [Mucilaginibacter sp. UR6-11]MCC8427226.1 hypothetical protein [Mucilaginibacter sp. UR6-11]